MTAEKLWFTVAEVAEELHVAHIWAWRLLRPHRHRCHLGRDGSNPRLVLWVPKAVVASLLADRAALREPGLRRSTG